ncbi:phosphotransferase family protein [Streptomyces europaeiscabiei]|uniref:phosphotransferase family protein n=1 Tax=Streptomyces europaeiscabiei TaxID=146819 RepID=UPI0029C9DE38|nr:aminoglycoside phosphotransferase family protein [Streptomyces europaeiscabiei]
MRTGRLLGSGRTADVYELHADESESGTDGHDAFAAHGGAATPDGLDDRDGADGRGGPGSRGEIGGPGGLVSPGGRAATGRTGSPEGTAGGWVLRRYRDGWGDAVAEAEIMEYVRAHAYPVPRVRSATRAEMVLERLSGPTMLEAVATGLLDPPQAGATLARLLQALHALPPRSHALSPPRDPAPSAPGHSISPTPSAPSPTREVPPTSPAPRVLHLDLHPENVILTPHGPQVIDWSNAEEGSPGLDWGVSAMILAQVAVDTADFRADMARSTLVSLLAHQPDGPSGLTEEGLVEAGRRRAANPTMTAREVELVVTAEELIRTLTVPATRSEDTPSSGRHDGLGATA